MQGLAPGFDGPLWAWLSIVALGAFHGVNPGMGWLFAVSNGMQMRRSGAVFLALPSIALGHFLAMAVALLPFAVLGPYIERSAGIRAAAGLILVTFGVYKLVFPHHPRYLARIGPSHLATWSFLLATAHGAGLMLVPVVLELCGDAHGAGHQHPGLAALAAGSLRAMLLAGTIHTLAMVLTGGAIAWVVYRYVGVALLRRAWLNLDLLWAGLLIVVGAIALVA